MRLQKYSKAKVMLSIALTLVFLAVSVIPVNSYAVTSYPYDSLSKRTALNKKMYDQAASSTSATRIKYMDKSLKDMYETKEVGLTAAQQKYIKTKADTIIADAAELKGAPLTEYEKLKAFHDWIVNNFYYYVNVDDLSTNCDNPYYLLTTESKKSSGKIRSRCNGYNATFVAFARSQNIPARGIAGHYIPEVRRTANESKWSKLTKVNSSHIWSQAYTDRDGNGTKEWIVVDCNADCWNSYSPSGGYVQSGQFYDKNLYNAVRTAYFDVSAKRLAQSHVMVSYRAGSKDLKYISNSYEKTQLKAFLNQKYSGKTNGKRINSSYSASKPETWFTSGDQKSKGDGYGRLYKLYWPSNKSLYGKLDLSKFTALQNVSITQNKLTSLYLKNCTSLKTVAASQNKLKTIDTRGSKKLTTLSVQGNPTTFVAYTFNSSKTAVIKSTAGGTVSVKFTKPTSTSYKHEMKAVAKSGYKFLGWYSGTKRFSTKASIVKTNKSSFTYVAKFKKL